MPMLVEENEFEASYFKSAKGERFDELIRVFGKSTRAVLFKHYPARPLSSPSPTPFGLGCSVNPNGHPVFSFKKEQQRSSCLFHINFLGCVLS